MKNLEKFKTLNYPIPKKSSAWRIYGKGMENFGDNRQPVEIEIPEPGDDEILVRSDAVGLCFSDTKIIKFGSAHPRLQGRDLKKNPVIPGHEVALTVMKVGKNRQKEYKPGERYIIQADIKYKGTKPAYGYIRPGGLSQYGIIGKEAIDGDGKSYLIPLKNENFGYSELALVEPWGCVVAAYRIKHRQEIRDKGNLLFIGNEENGKDVKDWDFSHLFAETQPGLVLLADVGNRTREKIEKELSQHQVKIKVESRTDCKRFVEKFTGGKGFDDIILLGDLSEDIVTQAADSMCNYGVLNYMASSGDPQTVSIDAGKIHYDVISFIGSLGTDVSAPYTENPDYTIKGESVLMLGAGGPMGQMHVQLAMDKADPPKTIVTTDIADERLDTLHEKFNPLAIEKGIRFSLLNPNNFTTMEEYRREILKLNNGRPYDYVVCLAAIPSVIEDAASYLGDKSVLNIFAGVSKGTIVHLNIKDTATKAARYIGSSGSTIDDMEYTLKKLEREELDTNNSVAGISGMNDVWKGIDAVRTGGFPGKIVVYPHIKNLDLVSLKDLKKKYPEIGVHLSKTGKWTREAEDALIDAMANLD